MAGIVKTHRLNLNMVESGDDWAPAVPDAGNESSITVHPRVIRDLLDHFPQTKSAKSDPQLIWSLDVTEVAVKSVEGIFSSGGSQLATEITISTDEFDVYNILSTPLTIGFHFREFNAVTTFAEPACAGVEFKFTQPGDPFFVLVDSDDCQVTAVISTFSSHGGCGLSVEARSGQSVGTGAKRKNKNTSGPAQPRKLIKIAQQHNGLASVSATPQISQRQQIPSQAQWGASPAVGPSNPGRPTQGTQDVPLFFPTQLSVADQEAVRMSGLGIETMSADELAAMLEDDGEEVEYVPNTQAPFRSATGTVVLFDDSPPIPQSHGNGALSGDAMNVDEENPGIDSTQVGMGSNFKPLFKD